MKNLTTLILVLFSILSFSQSEKKKEILIDKVQPDDVYTAGETIKVNAVVQGDLVIAGGNLIVNDSIKGDLTAAGGELFLNSYIADDARIAVGRVTIDSEIGDDLVVFGGEVVITENARISGKLVCFSGDVTINGEVIEEMDVRGGDIFINGTIRGDSKIMGEDITIGANAKFYKDVEYWHSDGEIDFKNSLVNAKAQFNEDLGKEKSQLSLTTFGTNSFKLWLYYVLSAFLAILVLHALFRNAFSNAVDDLENSVLKSFGFGLIYLIGIPLMILLTFVIAIGIPLGLFATAVFVFSILFGHYVVALLVVYYLRYRKQKNWSFWSITFLALICAILLRILTMIPYAGILISVIVISITYGALTLNLIHPKKQTAIN